MSGCTPTTNWENKMNAFVAKRLMQSEGIQITNGRVFSEDHWREAILYYLNKMWGGHQWQYHPKINFDGVNLVLDATGKYWCYIQPMMDTSIDTEARECQIELHDGNVLEVKDDQNSVEIGLIRFVRDDSIGCLKIRFEEVATKSSLSLFKTSNRGEYLTDGENLRRMRPARR